MRTKSEYSKSDLTVKLDAAAELGKLDAVEEFERSFWDGPEIDLNPILDLVNQLTRTFAVYAGNAATLFDKAFEDFMEKFRRSLQKAGMTIQTIDFTADDGALLENRAMSYISKGEFLQAFTYERLLTSQTMIKQVVNLPPERFSLRADLIRYALNDPESVYSACQVCDSSILHQPWRLGGLVRRGSASGKRRTGTLQFRHAHRPD